MAGNQSLPVIRRHVIISHNQPQNGDNDAVNQKWNGSQFNSQKGESL